MLDIKADSHQRHPDTNPSSDFIPGRHLIDVQQSYSLPGAVVVLKGFVVSLT